MNVSQIIRKLRARPEFAGVYAADELPLTVEGRPRLLVVNSDVASGLGKHWLALYFPEDGVNQFFDSTGHAPDYYHPRFQNLLSNNGTSYKFLNVRFQDFGSNTCGHYCVFYALLGCSLERIADFFEGQSKWQNDELMRQLFPT
jgi:hypothetical protein